MCVCVCVCVCACAGACVCLCMHVCVRAWHASGVGLGVWMVGTCVDVCMGGREEVVSQYCVFSSSLLCFQELSDDSIREALIRKHFTTRIADLSTQVCDEFAE